jgi:hypothetical protein
MSTVLNTYYRTLTRPYFPILQSIFLAFVVFIYYYLKRLETEKCECAMTDDYVTLRRLVVIVMFLLAFFILLSIVFQYIYKNQPSAPILTVIYILAFATGILDLVFLIISLRYIVRLYKIACECSDNGMRLTYMIYVIVRIALIAFVVIAVLFALIMLLAVIASVSASSRSTKPTSKSIKK